jgi:hypothetical protein
LTIESLWHFEQFATNVFVPVPPKVELGFVG